MTPSFCPLISPVLHLSPVSYLPPSSQPSSIPPMSSSHTLHHPILPVPDLTPLLQPSIAPSFCYHTYVWHPVFLHHSSLPVPHLPSSPTILFLCHPTSLHHPMPPSPHHHPSFCPFTTPSPFITELFQYPHPSLLPHLLLQCPLFSLPSLSLAPSFARVPIL